MMVRRSADAAEEALVPLRVGPHGQVDPATLVRSTLLTASVNAIKATGQIENYLRNLPKELHDPVLHSASGTWLDFSVAVAHYSAANSLQLSLDEQATVGREVSARMRESLLGTLVRLARGAGVTTWLALEQLPKLWDRMFIGGSAAVYRLGPKEARYEMHGIAPLAPLRFFRASHRGMMTSSAELFCTKMYMHDIETPLTPKVIAFRMSWV